MLSYRTFCLNLVFGCVDHPAGSLLARLGSHCAYLGGSHLFGWSSDVYIISFPFIQVVRSFAGKNRQLTELLLKYRTSLTTNTAVER